MAGAAEVLRSAIVLSAPPGAYGYWLSAVDLPVRRPSRLASRLAEKRGLWSALEARGVSVPRGTRRERRADHEDGQGFTYCGSIHVQEDQFAVAVEVTRRTDAVLLVSSSASFDPLPYLEQAATRGNGARSPIVLPAVLRSAAGDDIAARGFGAFDDVIVGAELFAMPDVLTAVEQHLPIAVDPGRT